MYATIAGARTPAPDQDDRALDVRDGWRTLADGMNVLRWFLTSHVHHEALLRRRYTEAADAAGPAAPLPGLAALRTRWSRGALLQLLHPGQPRAEAAEVLAGDGPGPRAVLAVAAGDGSSGSPRPVAPAAFTGPPALHPDLARRALDLLDRAGLGPLSGLATDVLLCGAPHEAAHPWQWDAGCVPVGVVTDAEEMAARLAAGVGAQVLAGYAAAYGVPAAATEPTLTDPRDGRPAGAQDLALAMVAVGHRCRVLSGPAAERARREAARLAPLLPVLRERLELTAFEYVNVTLPGPTQWEKYEKGGGIGQG
uniref:Uncharacterized protein n=1 Tax=Streptomyces sp. MMG1612 TaxID=1415547 RepID=U5YMY1_9ACTN|nr:hypothetical protein [Streptomyces sp. MMG1612]